MIVDSSAIMSIIQDEPDSGEMIAALVMAPHRRISAGTWIELSAVLTRRKNTALNIALDTLYRTAGLTITAVNVEQARIGHEAYKLYGHGSGHRADLNFGDCFAYALAKEAGEPLLFKGDDFIHTDIVPALKPPPPPAGAAAAGR